MVIQFVTYKDQLEVTWHWSQKKVTKNGQNKKLFQASKEDMPSIQNFVGVSDATGSKKKPHPLLPVPGNVGFTGLVVLIMLSPF